MSNQSPKYCTIHSKPFIDNACPECVDPSPTSDWLQKEESKIKKEWKQVAANWMQGGDAKIGVNRITPERAMDLAANGIYGEKNESYGPATREFEKMAKLHDIIWPYGFAPEVDARASHALYMILVKLVREVHCHKKDNYTDIIGYAQLADDAYENE